MVIFRGTGFRAQGPVIAQAFFHFVGAGRSGPAVIADTGRGLHGFFRCGAVFGILAVIGNGFCSGTGIFRPGISCQIGNGNFAFNIVIQHLANRQRQLGGIGDGDVRAAVCRQDPAVAGTGNAARQVNPAALGVNILHYQAAGLGIVIHLHNILEGADAAVVHRPAAVVHLVHGTALNGHRPVGGYGVNPILVADKRCLIFAVAALDEAVHVNIRRRDIHAVPGDAAQFRVSDVRCRLLQAGLGSSFVLRLITEGSAAGSGHGLLYLICVQVLGPPADVHDAVHIILGNGIAGRELHRPACNVGAFRRTADGNGAAAVADPDIAAVVGQIPKHRHIRNGSVGSRLTGGILHRDRSPRLIFIGDDNGAGKASCRIVPEGTEGRLLRLIFIQFGNVLIFGHAGRRDAGTREADFPSRVFNLYPIQFQVGVGVIDNRHPGGAVGFQPALPVQVFRLDRNIAAAGRNLRDFHITDC